MKIRWIRDPGFIWTVMKYSLAVGATAAMIWFAVVEVVPGVTFAVGYKRFAQDTLAHEEEIIRDWNATFGTKEDYMARHPDAEATADAKTLDERLERLGLTALSPIEWRGAPAPMPPPSLDWDEQIRLERERERQSPSPSPGERLKERGRVETDKQFATLVDEYLRAQLARESQLLDPPPPQLSEYLAAHESELSDAGSILRSGHLVWSLHLRRGPGTEIPNLLTTIRLARLLACAALEDLRTRNPDRALERLRALRRLADALDERGQLVSTLVAISIDRYAAAVFRKFQAFPDGAQTLFSDHGDRNEALKDALAGDIYVTEAAFGFSSAASNPGSGAAARAAAGQSHAKVWSLDTRRKMVDLYRMNRALDPCAAARPDQRLPEEPELSRFNLTGAIVIPNLRRAIWRASRLRVETEAAEKTAAVLSAVNGGRFATAIPGISDSVCRDARWSYTVTQDGRHATLEITPPLAWNEKLKGVKLPSKIEFSAL